MPLLYGAGTIFVCLLFFCDSKWGRENEPGANLSTKVSLSHAAMVAKRFGLFHLCQSEKVF